jgi:hypothetical protein
VVPAGVRVSGWLGLGLAVLALGAVTVAAVRSRRLARRTSPPEAVAGTASERPPRVPVGRTSEGPGR